MITSYGFTDTIISTHFNAYETETSKKSSTVHSPTVRSTPCVLFPGRGRIKNYGEFVKQKKRWDEFRLFWGIGVTPTEARGSGFTE